MLITSPRILENKNMASEPAHKAESGSSAKAAIAHFPTPHDQIHLVAAILATAPGPTQPTGDKPGNARTATMQRYRQFVRMLSRAAESGDSDEE
jgi:hypothetical protein